MPALYLPSGAQHAPSALNLTQQTHEQMSTQHPLDLAIEHIKDHWREIKTLRRVAKQFLVDPGNLARAFRLKEGITAKQFIDEQRKEHVLARLKSGKLLFYEIGLEIGFKKDYAFTRWATRAFGMSLTEMRGNRRRGKK